MEVSPIGKNRGLAAAVHEPAVFVTVQRFCRDRSMSRSTFYSEMKAGRIRPVKRGRRTLIHQEEARRYDGSLPAA